VAFPTAVATSGGNSTGDSTPTIALPDNAAVGDLMLIAIRTGQTVTVTWPASPAWVELFEDGSDASNDVTAVAYRRVDGTEGWGDTGNTIDLTLSSSVKSAYVAYKISGAIDPATQAPQHSTVTVGTGATIDPVSLTPTGGAKDYLWLLVATYDGVEVVGTAPSGYSNAVTGASSTGAASGNASVACCQRAANAASEEPGTWTIGGAGATVGWSAWTFAIHPSAAAAYTLTAASGSFALTGQTASLLQGYAFPAASGSFTLAGQTTGLLFGHVLSADAGAFALTGQSATLIDSGAPAASIQGAVAAGYDALDDYWTTYRRREEVKRRKRRPNLRRRAPELHPEGWLVAGAAYVSVQIGASGTGTVGTTGTGRALACITAAGIGQGDRVHGHAHGQILTHATGTGRADLVHGRGSLSLLPALARGTGSVGVVATGHAIARLSASGMGTHGTSAIARASFELVEARGRGHYDDWQRRENVDEDDLLRLVELIA